MSVAWKSAESEVARYFGGLRRSRGADYSQSIGDIIHPHLSIEVKWGKQIPKKLRVDRYTTLIIGRYVLYHNQRIGQERRRLFIDSQFLDKAFRQAKTYSPFKKAVVCLKPKGYKGFIIVEEWRSQENGRLS